MCEVGYFSSPTKPYDLNAPAYAQLQMPELWKR